MGVKPPIKLTAHFNELLPDDSGFKLTDKECRLVAQRYNNSERLVEVLREWLDGNDPIEESREALEQWI